MLVSPDTRSHVAPGWVKGRRYVVHSIGADSYPLIALGPVGPEVRADVHAGGAGIPATGEPHHRSRQSGHMASLPVAVLELTETSAYAIGTGGKT